MQNKPPYWALGIVYLVWGTTLGAIHVALGSIPPNVLACGRFLLAGLLLVGFCLLRGEPLPRWRDVPRHAAVAFFLFVAGHASMYWALQIVPVGMASAINATIPFWMLSLGALLPPHEKIPLAAWLGLGLGFLGMLVLLFPDGQVLPSGGVSHAAMASPNWLWVGCGVVLFSAISWAIGSTWARRKPTPQSLLMESGAQNLLGGVMLLPLAAFSWPAGGVHPTPAAWAAVAYLVVLGNLVALPCYLLVLNRLSLAWVGTIGYVTPVITLLFGAWFLGQPITLPMAVGTVIILSGVGLAQHSPTQTKIEAVS